MRRWVLILQNDSMQYSFKCAPHMFEKYDSTYKNGSHIQPLGIHLNLTNTHSWNVFRVQVEMDPCITVK